MKVGVVVPILNQYKLALEALASVDTIHHWEPIIIDNWRNPRSVSESWNLGIDIAIERLCDYILVINDDVVLSPWTIDNQIEYLENPHKKAAGVRMTTGWATGKDYVEMMNWPEPEGEGPFVSGADFACFLITPEVFNEIGRFDENFKPAYYEDNDYHRRVLMAEYKIEIVTTAPYLHYGSVTQKESGVVNNFQMQQNLQYYKNKWGGGPGAETYAHPYNDSLYTIRDWTEPA